MRKDFGVKVKTKDGISKKEIRTALIIFLLRAIFGIIPFMVIVIAPSFGMYLPGELKDIVYGTVGATVSAIWIAGYSVAAAVMGAKHSPGFALGMGITVLFGVFLLPLVMWPELLLSLAVIDADPAIIIPLLLLTALPILIYIIAYKCSKK